MPARFAHAWLHPTPTIFHTVPLLMSTSVQIRFSVYAFSPAVHVNFSGKEMNARRVYVLGDSSEIRPPFRMSTSAFPPIRRKIVNDDDLGSVLAIRQGEIVCVEAFEVSLKHSHHLARRFFAGRLRGRVTDHRDEERE